ncbi:Gfo/Idh/MocA family protein [Salisediminibacterium beveridgei]|nr:Gfo/Idh/MocA family oxidoreductase [Salisediminibacterium beveridgei]
MSAKWKVAIIGPGGIASGAHIPHYMSDPRTEVVAVCSYTEETALSAAKAFDIKNSFTDVDDMLKTIEPDLVSVCNPNAFHHDAVVKSLKAGCHVLCEKPPATSPLEAMEMERTAKETGKHLLYAFNHRHNLETKVLKRAIESGELGTIYHMNVTAMRRRGIPGWGVFTNKELQGGGPLIDIGVHMLDLAMYLSGFPKPVEVMGATHQRLGKKPGVGLLGNWDPQDYTVEDLATGMIRFEHGLTMNLTASYAANIRKDEHLNVELLGDKGGAETDPFTIYQEKYGSLFNMEPAYLEQTDTRDSYERQIVHFLDVVDKKTRPIITPGQGTMIQQIVEALYTSAKSRQVVRLSE